MDSPQSHSSRWFGVRTMELTKAQEEGLPLLRGEEAAFASASSSRLTKSLKNPVLVLLALLAFSAVYLLGFDAGVARGEYTSLNAEEDYPLTIRVTNEYGGYGNLTKYPFLAEGYGINVEPYKETELRIGNPKDWATYTWARGTSPKDSLEMSVISPTVEQHLDVDAINIRVSMKNKIISKPDGGAFLPSPAHNRHPINTAAAAAAAAAAAL